MRPYTFNMELREIAAQKRQHYAIAGDSWIAQPEIAIVVGKVLGNVTTGFTVFGSSALVLSILGPPVPLGEVLLQAGAVAGAGLLIKTVAMSEPLLFWLEVIFNKDINRDGFTGNPQDSGRPEPAPPIIPSESEGEGYYNAALKLWNYAYQQIRGARESKRKMRVKAWARRRQHGLTQDEWEKAIDVWVAGGLLRTPDARELETETYKRGIDYILQGMATLNFIRRNGEWWMPK